jgi:DoxX-like protein
MTDTIIWIGQGLLAVVFGLTGTAKLVVPRERLQPHMHWAKRWPRGRIKLLGLAELAGAIGLIVPRATGIAPGLTPIAALCLGVLMVGAARTHQQLGESLLPPVIVGALCALLAVAMVAA